MENLTKKEALRLCYKLWDWLAENPTEYKYDWPDWTYNGGQYYATRDCFACEYMEQQMTSTNKIVYCTSNCILPCFSSINGCTNGESPYVYYQLSTPKDASKYASIIRDSTLTEYKKLGGNIDDTKK